MSSTPKFTLEIGTNWTYYQVDDNPIVGVKTSDLASYYFQNTNSDSGVLPPVVRYLSPNFKAFLLERPPDRKIITVATSDGDKHTFDLPIPWTVYLIRFTTPELTSIKSLTVFGRNTQIYSEVAGLYSLPLPNLTSDGLLIGGGSLKPAKKNKDKPHVLNRYLDAFWNKTFDTSSLSFLSTIPEYFPKDSYVVKNEDGTTDFDSTSLKFLQAWSDLSLPEACEVAMQQARVSYLSELTDATVRVVIDKLVDEESNWIEYEGSDFIEFAIQLIDEVVKSSEQVNTKPIKETV